ncbi:MAG TPA: alanine--tRNA ligase [Solirubrobacteraceae bacterium]|jgi:alanyl-tRNA synthetase|nr:alanine--tRNA ligase [Solirubrobacteraceae bacterium]
MKTDEIRERYLAFFEERGHRRIPSASLVPSAHDPSALLTVAGMHPLKPYFLGQEQPPAPRLTSCQKCFRTVDIANVGNTSRHLTFFEMLGNFSIGDYFKREAIAFAWELSLEAFGFAPDDIWVTVFEGDEGLGLGPDEEAIALWEEVGVPSERIVACPRSENFWQAGPSGPCGPCSELYVDRGVLADGRSHRSSIGGAPGDLPGGENERFLEYWNLVFMQYDQHQSPDGGSTLTELPARNIDTGLGLNRLAAILQQKASVFETDQFAPLIELGERLSGKRYGEEFATDRGLRILADHSRATAFLVADGVVPSNEERGYVLRRVMRRAIQQARALEMEPGFLVRYAEVVRELMAGIYPELLEQRAPIEKWLASEEESFGRTLDQGLTTLRFLIDHAREKGHDSISAEDAFRLHDTFGFPFELTQELLAEEDLKVDETGFQELMEQQRARSRGSMKGTSTVRFGAEGTLVATEDPRAQARRFAEQAGAPTRFTGYETELQPTTVAALAAEDGQVLVKLADSPFYAAGGGQISDAGTLECERGDCRARVQEVYRLGDDQVLSVVLERGELEPSEPVLARVDHATRHATQCNHTATHLLHAALRVRLGTHVRQAGSYVGPDKLRFDFTHGGGLSEQELRDVEDQVNAWIVQADPVHPITTTLDEAKRLGAMALFGEKYGDVVRMVEIGEGEYSRELCGGTHVANTSEIGVFRVTAETSSAANVRRIEALTGPAAAQLLRAHDRELAQVAATLRTQAGRVAELVAEREAERKRLQKAALAGKGAGGVDVEALLAGVEQVAGVPVLAAEVAVADAKALPDLADRLKGRLGGDGVVMLGAAVGERAALLVSVAPTVVQRGVKAGAIVKLAAEVVGGGGGGRDTMAQAGGRDPSKLGEALAAARTAIEDALGD